jgi:hypothetical protein
MASNMFGKCGEGAFVVGLSESNRSGDSVGCKEKDGTSEGVLGIIGDAAGFSTQSIGY